MKITSTRNSEVSISFADALLNVFPSDGGLYIPATSINIKNLLPHDRDLSFEQMVAIVTEAMFPEVFTSAEAKVIAQRAFSGCAPILRKFDKKRYLLEMFHGPTGCHRDFGYLWLSNALDVILEKMGKKVFIVAAGTEKNSRAVSYAFGTAKNIKTIMLYPDDELKSIDEQFLLQNGGSIIQASVRGKIHTVENLIRSIYADVQLVKDFSLTLANTVNIGRLLSQTFFFFFCFMRLKHNMSDEMYYAIPSGNYGTLTAALYAWKCGMSAKAFFTDETTELSCDENGFCLCTPLREHSFSQKADPVSPSNVERLYDIFKISPTMMRALIFPSPVEQESVKQVAKEMYRKYGIFFDRATATAYVSAKKNIFFHNLDTSNVIVFQKDNPYFDKDFLEDACGEIPLKPKFLKPLEKKMKMYYPIDTKTDFVSLLKANA